METLKYRKETMQAVKYLTFVKFMLLSNCLFCQGNLFKGDYIFVSPGGLSSINLSFSKDNFTLTRNSDFGAASKRIGYFLIVEDTMILFHEKLLDPNPSYFIEKDSEQLLPKKPNSLGIALTVYNSKKQLISGSHITLLKDSSILSVHKSDTNGYVNVYTEDKIANRLTIDHLGLKQLNLDLADF